jgi:hypothetical protein
MNRDELTLTDSEAALEREAARLLRASAEALDGGVRSRLTAARFVALGELEKRGSAPRFRIPGAWLPAGALAAAAVLAVAVWVARPLAPTAIVAEASPVEDAELLASNEEPELYAEDADFYEWAENNDAPGGPG